jgi:hypothetical protein
MPKSFIEFARQSERQFGRLGLGPAGESGPMGMTGTAAVEATDRT